MGTSPPDRALRPVVKGAGARPSAVTVAGARRRVKASRSEGRRGGVRAGRAGAGGLREVRWRGVGRARGGDAHGGEAQVAGGQGRPR